MSVRAWLRLGRVSNLPTVWTNVLAAALLAGSGTMPFSGGILTGLLVFLSLFYVAGMILNDAFDAASDARLRPTRPIPDGLVSRNVAFTVGAAALVLSILGVSLLAWMSGASAIQAGIAGVALALVIVAYDWRHKTNPLSPVLMGMCRGLVFIVVASSVVDPVWTLVLVGAGLHLFYVIGLTYTAKQEDLAVFTSWWPLLLLGLPVVWPLLYVEPLTPILGATCIGFGAWLVFALWPLRRYARRIGVSVGRLIAGICIVDALLLASMNDGLLVAIACLCLALTLLFQRYVPGT